VPERLCRYVESEWPGPDGVGDFGQACRAWLAANPGRELPFARDSVEVGQEVVRLIRAGAGRPVHWDGTWGTA